MDDTDQVTDLMAYYELGREEAAAGYGCRVPPGADDEQAEAYRAGWRAGWRGGCVGEPAPDLGDV